MSQMFGTSLVLILISDWTKLCGRHWETQRFTTAKIVPFCYPRWLPWQQSGNFKNDSATTVRWIEIKPSGRHWAKWKFKTSKISFLIFKISSIIIMFKQNPSKHARFNWNLLRGHQKNIDILDCPKNFHFSNNSSSVCNIKLKQIHSIKTE